MLSIDGGSSWWIYVLHVIHPTKIIRTFQFGSKWLTRQLLHFTYHQNGGCRYAGCHWGRSPLCTDTHSSPWCWRTLADIHRCCRNTRPHLLGWRDTECQPWQRGRWSSTSKANASLWKFMQRQIFDERYNIAFRNVNTHTHTHTGQTGWPNRLDPVTVGGWITLVAGSGKRELIIWASTSASLSLPLSLRGHACLMST